MFSIVNISSNFKNHFFINFELNDVFIKLIYVNQVSDVQSKTSMQINTTQTSFTIQLIFNSSIQFITNQYTLVNIYLTLISNTTITRINRLIKFMQLYLKIKTDPLLFYDRISSSTKPDRFSDR